MEKFWHISAFLLAANLLAGQSPFFKFHEMEDAFKRTPAEVIYEDRISSLWFGSPKGLFLYDGLDFQHFEKDDSTTNHVQSIFRDKKNRLWVGYVDGSVFFLTKQKLQPWRPDGFMPRSAINGIAEDASGNVWISTFRDGLFCFLENKKEENENGQLLHFSKNNDLPNGEIHALSSDDQGRIWLGTDAGLAACSLNAGKIQLETFSPKNDSASRSVHSILPHKEGIWLGTAEGAVFYFDAKNQIFSDSISGKNWGGINSLALFEGTELWIGTATKGLWRHSFNEGALRPLARFRRTWVHDLHRDIEGNIWVLTSDHGIHSANRPV